MTHTRGQDDKTATDETSRRYSREHQSQDEPSPAAKADHQLPEINFVLRDLPGNARLCLHGSTHLSEHWTQVPRASYLHRRYLPRNSIGVLPGPLASGIRRRQRNAAACPRNSDRRKQRSWQWSGAPSLSALVRPFPRHRLFWPDCQSSKPRATPTPAKAARNPASSMFSHLRGATGADGNTGSGTTAGTTMPATWRCNASRLSRLARFVNQHLEGIDFAFQTRAFVPYARRSLRNRSIPLDSCLT